MKIPQEKFVEIAQANDIIDVISSYIQVKKRGKSFLALCPFHPDKNPSLHISQQKQVYHCFSCKASGNVYSFVENYEKITFMEAAQKLAQRAGIDLKFNSRDPDLSNEISKLFEINKSAAKYFHKNLVNLIGSEKEFIHNYLEQRKIDNKLIEKFGIGYSRNIWDGLLHYFLEEDIFRKDEIEKAGLVIQSEKDKDNYYDRFRGRLIFPIFNENDKVVGFGGRKLYEDDPGGKYINSPESKIYSKSKILYGLNFAKEMIRYHDYVILVEGYMDLISLVRNGIENVVASSGTALTEEQVKIISRYTKNVYVLFDSDFAGIKAAKRGIETILEAGLDLSVVTLPEGEDPDSFINKFGKGEFEKYLNKNKSVINFISELYGKEGKLNTVSEKTLFVKEIIGYIGKVPDKIKRAFYIKEISKMYSLYESDMRDELEKVLKENKARNFPKTSVVIPERKNANGNDRNKIISDEEKSIVNLFVNGDDESLMFLCDKLYIDYIKSKEVLNIVEYFLNEYHNEGKIDVSKALNQIEDEESKNLISLCANAEYEISQIDNNSRDRLLNKSIGMKFDIKYAKDVIKKFETKMLEEQRDQVKKDISISSDKKVMEIFEITKQLNELNKGY